MVSNGSEFVADEIRKVLRRLSVATVLLYMVVGFVAVSARVSSAHDHNALCAFRSDLTQRVEGSKKFLRNHPQGIQGIEPSLIRDGIRNQQRTINSLDHGGLSC